MQIVATGASAVGIEAFRLFLESTPGSADSAEQSATTKDALRLITCETLHTQLGHDFSQDEDQTFQRRVQRVPSRMTANRPARAAAEI